jgi:DNA-binding XRE family transcriptional regulator
MSDKKKIFNNVQKYRVWKGIKQTDLAKALNISLSNVRSIEDNTHCPRMQTRLMICEFFGVSYDQMFYE